MIFGGLSPHVAYFVKCLLSPPKMMLSCWYHTVSHGPGTPLSLATPCAPRIPSGGSILPTQSHKKSWDVWGMGINGDLQNWEGGWGVAHLGPSKMRAMSDLVL